MTRRLRSGSRRTKNSLSPPKPAACHAGSKADKGFAGALPCGGESCQSWMIIIEKRMSGAKKCVALFRVMLFSRGMKINLLKVTDITSPTYLSHIQVEIVERKGNLVKVSARYCEALTLAPKGMIPDSLLLPLGSVKEGWVL